MSRARKDDMPPKFRLCTCVRAREIKKFLLATSFTLIVALGLAPHALAVEIRTKATETAIASATIRIYVSASAPKGLLGAAYSGVIAARGGTAPYTFSAKGTLPPGVTLNSSTGVLSGRPSAAGIFSFTAYATDSNGFRGDKGLSVTIGSTSSPQEVSVQISPASATLMSGGSQQFSASVSGSSNTGVTWSTTAGSISGTGVLTAPTVSAVSYVTVTATSSASASAKASATVAVAPLSSTNIRVSVNPLSAIVPAGKTQQFSASVTGTSNTSVVWSTTAGSISATGVLTAPSVTNSSLVTVTAKSAAKLDARASATVTVNPQTSSPTPPTPPTPVSISLSPGSALVQPRGTVQFNASVSGSSNTAVTWRAGFGSISSSGLYTAPSTGGTDTVIATSQADPTKAASAAVTIQASTNQGSGGGSTIPTPPNPAGNAYCTPSGTWSGAAMDGPANLPVHCMYTPVNGTPSPGTVRGPDSTTSAVQADINAAACGDTILVAAGSTLGSISLAAKGCDSAHWITIQSSGVNSASFPAEGVRMTPCWSGLASMPNRPAYSCPAPQVLTFKIVTPASSNGIVSYGGDHYRIIGAEITRVSTGGAPIYNLVDLSSTGTQTSNIIFDRSWFHGINQDGNFPMSSQSADTSTTRAIYLGQSNHIAVIDSYFSDFYDTGSMSANGNTDAQCIGGGFGTITNSGWGVYKFVNNHCEASGEGILLGGAVGPKLTPAGCTIGVNCSLDVPADIEVRQNYFFKPLSWNGNSSVPVSTGWPVVKNGFEMKIGARALFEGNVIENVWYSAQVGYCWSTAPKNQSSNGTIKTATAPTALTNDFTYRYNYCYNTAYGIGLYQSMDAGCSNCEAQGANRISIHDNVIGDDLNMGNLSSTNSGDGIEVYSAPDSTGQGLNQLNNVNISHNTFVKAIRALAIFGGAPGQMHNWTVQDNLFAYGNYGFMSFSSSSNSCDGGSNFNNLYLVVQSCVSNWVWDHNSVFNWNGGTLGAKWPTNGAGSGNFFFAGTSGVGFSNYGTGDSAFRPGNYAVTTSSPLHNAASDGTDIGADIATLLTMISGVRQ